MEFLIKATQLILSLSILVVLHELGHFVPARLFGTRVEKFFLFFDAGFALWKKKIGDTVFGIGWIPFGGYVKISGMIDESMDKDQLSKPPEPWEFRSKPAWQRLIIMVGGVTVNLLLGMLIYIGILWVWGRDYLPLASTTYGVEPSAVMVEEGFRPGDRILGVEGHDVRSVDELGKAILIGEARSVQVERDGRRETITLSGDVDERILDRKEKVLFLPRVPFVIDSLVPGSGAAASTLRVGDRVIGVGGRETPYFADFQRTVRDLSGQWTFVDVERDGKRQSMLVEVSERGAIGAYNTPLDEQFELAHQDYGFTAAIPAGIAYGWNTLSDYVSSLKLLFSPAGASQIGGFGVIGSLFPSDWDWQRFWEMTAFLSIILAFMNILPIPALDGGHVMFLLYEMLTRRPPNQKVLEVAQMVGMVLLLSLILFANGNDVVKWFTGEL